MRLAGVLPSELGLLTALTALDMADKGLVGTIPTPVYQNLVQLQYLDIGANRLVSLSPDIAYWSQLQTLIVANNYLYGALPTELYALTNLQVLLLQTNPLASGRLLESIGSWPAMEILDVSKFRIIR
jgi:Leucine-rich repeat (LRR) protein